jgi:hypothetical protein
MGEAKRKSKEWVRLFEPPLQARIAISRPGARPISTRKYEQSMPDFIHKPDAKPAVCFNFNCSRKLLTVPDVFMFVQIEEHARPIGMGVCDSCAAQYDDDGLRALVREQYGSHYGLKQQPPENSARVEIDFEPGIAFVAEGVPFFLPGRKTPTMPGALAAFIELLEAGELQKFMTLRRGISNCHGIVGALYQDLVDTGCAHLFVAKRGSCGLLKTEHDPDGLHSWIEVNGWVIDVANGADRPIIVMPVNDYHGLMQMTDVRDIGKQGLNDDDA